MRAFGSCKDWRVSVFSIICIIGLVLNICITIFITKNNSNIYCPLMWLFLLLLCRIKGTDSLLIISILLSLFTIFTTSLQNASVTVFLVLMLKLSKDNKQRLWLMIVLFMVSVIWHSLNGIQLIYLFSIIVEFLFSLFIYYGFFYICQPNKEDILIIATDKEYDILEATIWQDKSMKETAYDLGMSYSALMNCLKRCRERNNYNTTESLIRDYKVQRIVQKIEFNK